MRARQTSFGFLGRSEIGEGSFFPFMEDSRG